MATGKRKASRRQTSDQKPDAQPGPESEKKACPEQPPAAESGATGFLGTVAAGLKAAGKTAEKYTRLGLTHAELEKLRLDLKAAYSRLGEAVSRCWDAAPDIGVTASDPAVKEQAKAVNDLRRRIREIETKIRTINQAP